MAEGVLLRSGAAEWRRQRRLEAYLAELESFDVRFMGTTNQRPTRWVLPALAVTVGAVLLSCVIILRFVSAKAGNGLPSIWFNVQRITDAKQSWALDKQASMDSWPAESDLAPYLVHADFRRAIGRVRDEVYVINRVDRPVCVYFPRDFSWRGYEFKAGQLLTLDDLSSAPKQRDR